MNMTQYDEQDITAFNDACNSCRDNILNAKDTRALLKGKVNFQFIRNPGINTYVSGSKHTGTKSKKCKRKQAKKRKGSR